MKWLRIEDIEKWHVNNEDVLIISEMKTAYINIDKIVCIGKGNHEELTFISTSEFVFTVKATIEEVINEIERIYKSLPF